MWMHCWRRDWGASAARPFDACEPVREWTVSGSAFSTRSLLSRAGRANTPPSTILKSPAAQPITFVMDRLSVIGVVLAIGALMGGSVLKGAGLSSLWSPAAFVIVILGTTASILVQTPMPTFRRAM